MKSAQWWQLDTHLLGKQAPSVAEYVWLRRFKKNQSQQKSAFTVTHESTVLSAAWYTSCWIDKQALTVAQKALFFDSLIWVIEMNKHYCLTEQETQKLSICFTYIIFNAYIVILLYSLLILHVNYHHHELQQLLYKVTTHLNSYLWELQPMIHSHEKMTDRKRSMKCCWSFSS